jgi:hypothetical protein
MKTEIVGGVVHEMPADLRKALRSNGAAVEAWQDITPLARNEWICWVEDAKEPDTRARRIDRARTELAEGKRRPCCWMGCIHRTDKPISPSVQWVIAQRSKKPTPRHD